MRHVERSLADPRADLSLEAVARVAAMSPYHFHRSFRAIVGDPLQAWVRRLRLERAATLLVHSRWPVAEVGVAAGYETQAAFTRAFTRQFGVPPAKFRARSGQTPWLLPPGEGSRRTEHGVLVTALPERRLACVRHVGDLATLSRVLGPLVELAERSDWFGADAWAVLVFYDDSQVVDPVQWRIDVGWPVPAGVTLPDGFSSVLVPEGDYAVATAAGNAAELDEAFNRFFYEEIPGSGLQPAAFESFMEVPCSYVWEALVDPQAFFARPMVARVLHQVGPPGRLFRA
jgi:AraC family transcriptional regulator